MHTPACYFLLKSLRAGNQEIHFLYLISILSVHDKIRVSIDVEKVFWNRIPVFIRAAWTEMHGIVFFLSYLNPKHRSPLLEPENLHHNAIRRIPNRNKTPLKNYRLRDNTLRLSPMWSVSLYFSHLRGKLVFGREKLIKYKPDEGKTVHHESNVHFSYFPLVSGGKSC